MKQIQAANGKLGILTPGMGAVASTFIAGVIAVRKNLAEPIGSITQMAHIRLGKRTDNRNPRINDFIPLAQLPDLEFGGWDIFPDNLYEAACHAEVLEKSLLDQIKPELSAIQPMKAVFHTHFVKRLNGTYIKTEKTVGDMIEAVKEDMRQFKASHNCERLVMVWCGSTEIYSDPTECPTSLEAIKAMDFETNTLIAPSMIYTIAAFEEGVPFMNGAPNTNLEPEVIQKLAKDNQVPFGGKDFKTGQTLMKTILAPGLKTRMLGLRGWFSTNILGNRDGEVLDDPESFKSKEISKLSVLEEILQPTVYPKLYKDAYHKVRINYYPPHGDNKESWDNIDITGWLGYPMQIKINFLCRDSILAAPLVLDLALFADFAKRAGMSGIQEWLSFYFKSPQAHPDLKPEHDIFIQYKKLKNTLRYLMGEDLITHLGNEYYDF